ncbi:MAG: hypothetical protein FJZ64_00325 [Chlamydiae bacterium]|nr:hypothetical protein [Chlamydiota bacterium]
MLRKRIIGICIGLSGVVMLGVAGYINKQLVQGRQQVTSAQKKVSQGKTLFGLNPITGEIGDKAIINPAEKKIRAGKEEIARYETIANRLQIGGIVMIVAGIIIFLLPPHHPKK